MKRSNKIPSVNADMPGIPYSEYEKVEDKMSFVEFAGLSTVVWETIFNGDLRKSLVPIRNQDRDVIAQKIEELSCTSYSEYAEKLSQYAEGKSKDFLKDIALGILKESQSEESESNEEVDSEPESNEGEESEPGEDNPDENKSDEGESDESDKSESDKPDEPESEEPDESESDESDKSESEESDKSDEGEPDESESEESESDEPEESESDESEEGEDLEPEYEEGEDLEPEYEDFFEDDEPEYEYGEDYGGDEGDQKIIEPLEDKSGIIDDTDPSSKNAPEKEYFFKDLTNKDVEFLESCQIIGGDSNIAKGISTPKYGLSKMSPHSQISKLPSSAFAKPDFKLKLLNKDFLVRKKQEQKKEIVMLIDDSGSMGADSWSEGLSASPTVAKVLGIIENRMELVKKGYTVRLFFYTHEIWWQSVITKANFDQEIERFAKGYPYRFNGGGTDIQSVLEIDLPERLKEQKAEGIEEVIIITDGHDDVDPKLKLPYKTHVIMLAEYPNNDLKKVCLRSGGSFYQM